MIKMCPWALNTRRGCIIHNEDIGELPSSTAIPITARQALIAKHLSGVVVFDKIAGVDIDKVSKSYLGVELSKIQKRDNKFFAERRTYESFMKQYKDPKIASQKWAEYKKELGLKEVKKEDDKPNNN